METLKIRKAEAKELDRIMQIYDHARRFMEDNGNGTQWAGGYPSEELLRNDIAEGQLYVMENDSGVHGVFAFIIGRDETYDIIEDGQWMSDTEYGTIHRIAGDGTVRGLMQSAVEFCRSRISHLRIDTHENNHVMQHLIEKTGFRRCGVIYIADGTPRIAYELI